MSKTMENIIVAVVALALILLFALFLVVAKSGERYGSQYGGDDRRRKTA